MKKKHLVLIPIFILIIISICGCSKKLDSISSKDFKKILGGDFEYTDLTSQYKQNKKNVTSVIHAKNSDGIELEFWEFDEDRHCSIEFHQKRARIENLCPSNHDWSQDGYDNMIATGSDDKVYYRIVRIKNTFVYSVVPINKESECIKLFEKLGYVIK